ncbi:hypothetical protein DFAR_2740025 [Desulfarculales bacterium]
MECVRPAHADLEDYFRKRATRRVALDRTVSLAAWSKFNLTAMLRLNLFTYRELRAWLQHPYHTPPLMPEQV